MVYDNTVQTEWIEYTKVEHFYVEFMVKSKSKGVAIYSFGCCNAKNGILDHCKMFW